MTNTRNRKFNMSRRSDSVGKKGGEYWDSLKKSAQYVENFKRI